MTERAEPARKVWFLWVARCTGTPFVVEGYDVVTQCPVCGISEFTDPDDGEVMNAFDASHCVRINEENLLGGVRL